ncbi:MAG: ACT domain-containing protein, partial [Oscillospiraceae bacterium]|nr:ACT domain-containing protein [Oscillospiraceae bacterium]
MSMRQISVFLENKPGTLERMTQTLADGGVNLRAISMAESADYGIARIIVDDLIGASTVLKDADFVISLTP